MAGKVLLLLGLGAGALLLAGGTAHADSGPPTGPGTLPPHPQGFDINNPPADVLKLILTASTSANPALMRSTADHLDELGYHPQATALRAAADAVEAAQKALPAIGTPTPGNIVLPAPGGPQAPPIILPPMVIPSGPPSGADPLAAQLTAQLNLTDPITNGRTPANGQNDLVTKFQAQEKGRGNYTGALDGLYGPGVALAVAGYNIVPYPPFYWSATKSKTASMKSAFKAAMLKKAGADPTRADEWSHVATAAQNT